MFWFLIHVISLQKNWNTYPIFQFDDTTIEIVLLSHRSDDRYRIEVRLTVIVNLPILVMLLAVLHLLSSASLPSIEIYD